MDVVDRSRVVASATWWHGTKPTAGGAAARGSLDRAVASFGTVPHPGAGCRSHRAGIDWRLASAVRCARQAGTSPRWSSGPVGSGGTREWSNASASQPSRDLGTGRRPAQPCPLTFKSNDPADLHAELGKCICRGTVAKKTVHRVSTKITPNFRKIITHALHCGVKTRRLRYSRLRRR